jgi:hypothetical protein
MQLPLSLLPDDYLPHLDALNKIIADSGAPLEGNLFYFHHQIKPSRNNIYDHFLCKRANFAAACRASNVILEVGVNGGHSALLALANGVVVHGVDICFNAYTRAVAKYLKEQFGDRFFFYEGDSLKVLPQMAKDYPDLRFDMMHIDGHHNVYYCKTDTENAYKMAMDNAWVLIDDTDLEDINDFFEKEVAQKRITPEKPDGWVDNSRHKIGKFARGASQLA